MLKTLPNTLKTSRSFASARRTAHRISVYRLISATDQSYGAPGMASIGRPR